jgi:hypothetical protein
MVMDHEDHDSSSYPHFAVDLLMLHYQPGIGLNTRSSYYLVSVVY